MKKPQILITDTLFVNKKQEKMLTDAGYAIERLPLSNPTEEQLIKAVKGKVGYIIGGVEEVTKPVIEVADTLKAIVFTGIDYKGHIPAWQFAEKKGIALGATPDAPTQSTAEWAFAAALLMNRRLIETSRTGTLSITTPGLQNQRIGIIGFGRIGQTIAQMCMSFKPAVIHYYTNHPNRETDMFGVSPLSLKELLQTSDIVFLCIPVWGNENFMGEKEFAQMKDNTLFVTISNRKVINENALFTQLRKKRLRAASAYPLTSKFDNLPVSDWYCGSDGFASNTFSGINAMSEGGVKKLLFFLKNK